MTAALISQDELGDFKDRESEIRKKRVWIEKVGNYIRCRSK